jgi:DNA processing protein
LESVVEWIELSLIPGVGVTSFWRLLDQFKTPHEVFNATKKQLEGVQGLRPQVVEAIANYARFKGRAEQELVKLSALGGCAISFEDNSYPSQLKVLTDPPPVLYLRGREDTLNQPAVAIVGSRAATDYGRKAAFTIAKSLTGSGVTVVSGLALGIDSQAHSGALAGKGGTVAVLGCGLDVVYPRDNFRLFQEIVERGAIISEYPLATRPEGFRFPARNRIIAGLCLGVLVVEAAKRSGSLITAQIALDSGREVFAVPGHIDSSKSEGTHWLLRHGAKLVQRAEDVIEELALPNISRAIEKKDTLKGAVEINHQAYKLLQLLTTYPMMREELVLKSGIAPEKLSELLLMLELDGLVELLPGDKIKRL